MVAITEIPITKEEVTHAIRLAKNRKTNGQNEVCVETLKLF